ncbi:MFS transporter [candidate division KSB3 bacterium]|uniref:MFS transporter n=1 Tax=candidate division KSB3 bacterium TaxID=2044937 RepID=A0A9D5Q6M4_9BACT|nr:MFS transporter [candidate division KSB3 bacterium]MBD3325392.1 MFS transporter [candidate division KSB3 bacterium]
MNTQSTHNSVDRSAREHVALPTKIAYVVPAFALAVVGIPIYVYLPKFYTDVVGVHVTMLGYLILGVRIFDALTDPLIGLLSDHTSTRFGRRRPYIAGGATLLAIALYLLFHPPHLSSSLATVWFGVGMFAVFLFWTVVVVPYEALGPEITYDYDERTTLFGLRDGALIAGTLAAATSPAAVAWLFELAADASGERAKFFWIAVLYIPLLLICCWGCVLVIQERRPLSQHSMSLTWSDVTDILRNTPFIILLIAYTISAFGSHLPATLILYYVEYVLLSPHADLFLVLYFVTGIVFLPGWMALAHRWGKKESWLLSMAVNTGAFIGVFFLGPGDARWYGILVFLSGIGFGATVAIPSAMQADVIDYDTLLSGTRREGHYVGIWSIAKKFAAALGVGAAISILGLSGYVPNVPQTAQVQLTLRVLYALVPSICNLIALGIAFKYPISRDIHHAIRAAIAERQAGKQVVDPLDPSKTLF